MPALESDFPPTEGFHQEWTRELDSGPPQERNCLCHNYAHSTYLRESHRLPRAGWLSRGSSSSCDRRSMS